MSLELQDWISYCKGEKDFDKSHFYTLLMNNDDGKEVSLEEISNVFNSFPNAVLLAERLATYYSKESFLDKIDHIKDFLVEKTINDITSKRLLFKGDDLEEYLKNKVYYVDKIDDVLNAKMSFWQNEEYIDVIEDHLFDNRLITTPKIETLFEAYFGLARNYQLVWYLGSPLINTGINFDYYFDIWKVGGDYAITEDAIIVSRHKSKPGIK
ncbi:hypothetical protein [Aquimarina agarilytica]|uniref:hypothetical protein n=1 Tax=Aquimarina agarilytica TaxID=1087449 RepID=UPI000287B273|nr:hypothetical protein [Aquimarina agarilytica]